MEAFVVAPAGFLLAVLWFDLMFDVQIRRASTPAANGAALSSISAYYRRVTTDARPMNNLVSVAMLATLVAIIVEIVRADPAWCGWTSLPLALGPMAFALTRTVPNAIWLGAGTGNADDQLSRALTIRRDHTICFASIAALNAVQLLAAA